MEHLSHDLLTVILEPLELACHSLAAVCRAWHGAISPLMCKLNVLALSGGNMSGQLGTSWTKAGQLTSLRRLVTPNKLQVKSFACGHYATYIVTSDGSIFSFGRNEFGQLGIGSEDLRRATPTRITAVGTRVKMIAGGQDHTCFLTVDGRVYSCGSDEHRQLPLSLPQSEWLRRSARQALCTPQLSEFAFEAPVTQIACGQHHTVLLLDNGALLACGANFVGQLGVGHDHLGHEHLGHESMNPNRESSLVPMARPLQAEGADGTCEEGRASAGGPVRFVSIACGKASTFALTREGALFACGWNNCGQLGLGYTSSGVMSLERVPVPNDEAITHVSSGAVHTCVVTSSGRLLGCGFNGHGQLADLPKKPNPSTSLVLLHMPSATHMPSVTCQPALVRSVTCGYEHTCVLRLDGFMWTCGRISC
jgi:alpha-tubulin suppressor-like RCC1 family protein